MNSANCPRPAKRRAPKSHLHVHFAAMAELYEFDDYGPESRPNTWYEDWDYERFERNRMHDILVHKRQAQLRGRNAEKYYYSSPNQHDGTIRGLENSLSTYAHKLYAQRRAQVVEAVLETQDRLYAEGISDACAIAFASTRCTYSSKNEARERGYEDHIDVKNMLAEDEKEKLKTDAPSPNNESNYSDKKQVASSTAATPDEQEQPPPRKHQTKKSQSPGDDDVTPSKRHNYGFEKDIKSKQGDERNILMSPENSPSSSAFDCFNPLGGISQSIFLPCLLDPPLVSMRNWTALLLRDVTLPPPAGDFVSSSLSQQRQRTAISSLVAQ